MSQHLKILCDPDSFFSVKYHGSNYSAMIAPGLVHIYDIRFKPEEKRDYEYCIKFVNDTEVFVVPIIGKREIIHIIVTHGHTTTKSTGQVNIVLAIGSRPILDIPNRIEIPATAVKIPSSKIILVRNLGDAPAIFNFSTDKYVLHNI